VASARPGTKAREEAKGMFGMADLSSKVCEGGNAND
jgi:hypothetical protein